MVAAALLSSSPPFEEDGDAGRLFEWPISVVDTVVSVTFVNTAAVLVVDAATMGDTTASPSPINLGGLDKE